MKIRSLSLTGAILGILVSSQCAKSPTEFTSTETTNGTISGKLVDSRGQPAAGAKVRLIDSKYIPSFSNSMQKRSETALIKDTVVLTNAHGEYFLPLPDSGTYNIFGEAEKGLNVMIASVSVKDTAPVKVGTDTVLLPGEIKGISFMPGQDSISQVRVILAIPGTYYTTIPSIGGSFSFTKVPQGVYSLIFNPTLPEYNVKVLTVNVVSGRVTDLDTVILYGKEITGLPKVDAGNDTVVSVGDTLRLHGTAIDPFGKIVAMQWDIGGTGIFQATITGDLSAVAPAAPASDYRCVFRAIDNEGNSVSDTAHLKIVAVSHDTPVIEGLSDTAISINDTIAFSVSARDSNGIRARYYWDFGANSPPRFDTTDSGKCSHVFPKTPQPCTVSVAVFDSTGAVGGKSVVVNVVLDPPVANAGRDTTVRGSAFFTVLGSGTDRYGKIVMYRFDTNGDEKFEDSSQVSGVKKFKAPPTGGTYPVILQVQDDDGNKANSMMLLDVQSSD